MYYDKGYSYATYEKDKVIVVDLRSDTLTKPTQKMREALSSAEVGDDVFHEDPTVKVLQETAAKMVGMEDALFVCSGTMANLIAILGNPNLKGRV
ncbi:probable low-specificity L-threonine aldolase 1 isoform X8 [Bombus pyrosoma]|uniref:probable low-specificity L-threonine aldolase 1 isoform X8 n=1 Tax=Bombus pyrosoma TaxID=396416 RepID=UPI001CB9B0A8|nr:probable low-specificity L-threonine aldolase 1 isoform X8 [Bombus pyrosoma]